MNDTNNIKSIKQIIEWTDGKSLIIPNLQRDYVWGKPEWRRLWDDIISVLDKIEDNNSNDKNPQHFTGVVTFKEEEDGSYAVLDGQQRLTTIAILLDYLCYVKDPTNGQTASKLSAFKSRVTFDGDPMESIEDKKNKYIEVYSFFMDCHLEINYSKVDELLDIVLNRLFIMVHISAKDENANDIFEGLNATGKNLEYSDLLLNALLEEAATGEEGNVKDSWEKLLKKICGVEEIPFENEEGETVEKVKDAPLKLKKYFNAINAMTTGESGSIVESVAEFNAILNRLREFGNAVLRNKVDSSSDKINTLSKWADVYQMIIDPVGSYKLVNEKKYFKELYYLSLWNTTAYIPTIMRIIYRNVKLESTQVGYYSDIVVKNMLKAILSVVVYTRIILNRVHADDRNVENQIRYLDFIYDANYKNQNSKEFGNTYEDILSIIYGLPTVANEIFNRADEVIRAYLYTSSGSKFLLALYADSMLENKSVCLLEHDCGKAQVEHMVSQNLCDGSFSDYGYDVSSIGLLDNLILLSSTTNKSIGDRKPEDKCACWKDDCFGRLFDNVPDNWKGFRASQQPKVEGIIDTFINYFRIEQVQNAASNNNYTFARKDKKNGRTEVLKYEYYNECKAGSSEQQYLVIKDDRYDEVPKSIAKSVISVFYKEEDPDQIKEHNDFAGLCGIIQSFIKQIDETENFYTWLLKCEESIKKPTNGSNEVTMPNDKTFTYSQKMIHTDELHKYKDKCSVIMGRKAEKKTSANGGAEYFEINNCKFALSNDFNNADVIKQLQIIYSNYDCETKKKFGFWVSVTYKIPVFIGNVLIQTNYINIGDAQIYGDWIKKTPEHRDIFENSGSDNSPLVSNGEEAVQSYFNCERLSLCDLIQDGDKIKIPEYQRAYVWDKSNWDALFQQLINKDKEVFLGTVVIRKENNNSWYVVDGQQRLSTLTGFYAEINYLENVMILETNINKAVKDKCLSDKICFNKGNNKAPNYSYSTSFMTRMVCEMQQKNEKNYYDCEFAQARLKKLQKLILPKLEKLLESVLGDSSNGIPREKFDLECNLNISTSKKSNSRTKKSQNTASQKKKSTGKDNLIRVVEYTTQFAVEDQTISTKWDTAFVKKCRIRAIKKIVDELGMEDKYKSTITSNITRDAKIKTVDDVDTALLALWKGESNLDLVNILKIIGNKSASLKSNIEELNIQRIKTIC